MEGAAEREKKAIDLAFWQAWHTEAFARMKGEHFKEALSQHFATDAKSQEATNNARAINFFLGLKARGVPVEITRH